MRLAIIRALLALEAENKALREALELIADGRRQPGLWANLSREEMQQSARRALSTEEAAK